MKTDIPTSGPEFCRRILLRCRRQKDMADLLGTTAKTISVREKVGDFSKDLERKVRTLVADGKGHVDLEEWMLVRGPSPEEWERFKALDAVVAS